MTPAKSVVRQIRKSLWRSKRARRKRTLVAAHRVVNQLTGFILSDYHLSTQVHSDGWAFLNNKSVRLDKASMSKIPDNSVIYVNSQETELFATTYLPHLTKNFVLISGEIWSPLQPCGSAVDTMLSHPGLLAWFCQNREDDNLPLRPFPFGVALRGINTVVQAMDKHRNTVKDGDVFVPYSAVHPHLEGEVADIRKRLEPVMAEPMRHQDYLEQLARHRFVISPAGDRPDTFRHWESVAMGAIPVSTLPNSFSELFGDSIILVDDLASSVLAPLESKRKEANRELATTRHWRQVVSDAKDKL